MWSADNPEGWPNLELLLIGGMLSSEETLRRNFGIRDDLYNKVMIEKYKSAEYLNLSENLDKWKQV